MARAWLRDRHLDNLHHKLEMLKAQQGVAATGAEEKTGDGAETTVKAEPDSLTVRQLAFVNLQTVKRRRKGTLNT
jgi:hypothetical protein